MNHQHIAGNATRIAPVGGTCLTDTLGKPTVQQVSFEVSSGFASYADDQNACQPTLRSLDTLRPHPSLTNQKLVPADERLLILDKMGETIFEQPLLITNDNVIVDGYARWIIARRQGRGTLLCIVSDLSEQEALQRILQSQTRRKWINDYLRILLALDLEPWLREQTQTHQSAGGREKASSKLTEDQRLDCRQRIAKVADVSTGNVTKVKQIHAKAIPAVIEALRSNEISIHWAWTIRKLSTNEQSLALKDRRTKEPTSTLIRTLLSRCTSKTDVLAASICHLRLGLTGLKAVPGMSTRLEQIEMWIRVIENEFHAKENAAHVR